MPLNYLMELLLSCCTGHFTLINPTKLLSIYYISGVSFCRFYRRLRLIALIVYHNSKQFTVPQISLKNQDYYACFFLILFGSCLTPVACLNYN